MDKTNDKSIFTKAITSESFLEKAILLILTVLLSGWLIPYFTNKIQRTKAKNEVILQAQSNFFDEVSKTVMLYETLLADITWFRSSGANDSVAHQKAFEKYNDKAVGLLAEWRAQSIKARNLTSQDISLALDKFQRKVMEQDSAMNNLHTREMKRGHVSPQEWNELHKVNVEMLTEAKNLLIQLAKDMNITKDNIK